MVKLIIEVYRGNVERVYSNTDLSYVIVDTDQAQVGSDSVQGPHYVAQKFADPRLEYKEQGGDKKILRRLMKIDFDTLNP